MAPKLFGGRSRKEKKKLLQQAKEEMGITREETVREIDEMMKQLRDQNANLMEQQDKDALSSRLNQIMSLVEADTDTIREMRLAVDQLRDQNKDLTTQGDLQELTSKIGEKVGTDTDAIKSMQQMMEQLCQQNEALAAENNIEKLAARMSQIDAVVHTDTKTIQEISKSIEELREREQNDALDTRKEMGELASRMDHINATVESDSESIEDVKENVDVLRRQTRTLAVQNNMMRKQLELIVDTLIPKDEVVDDDTLFNTGTEIEHNGVKWRVAGYKYTEPLDDFDYFPGLNETSSRDLTQKADTKNRVVSTIIPCFNEQGEELKQTIESLKRQQLPPGWTVEVVIVMDGVDYISPSMKVYLETLFGISINTGHAERDPFKLFPKAETTIIEPADQRSALKRRPACQEARGGYTLILKRNNHRKANSQMWWLAAHAPSIKCKYAMATDCGTIFEETALIWLLMKLEEESNVHAVSGFHRVMTSRMQGDGALELLEKPFDFMLRMLQMFEFEVDHCFRALQDSIGALDVIPGPCGLYRFSKMGNMKEGLIHQYFKVLEKQSKSLLLGNLQLVEDRIPGVLLSFPLKHHKEKSIKPKDGWPRTCFVHEAIFYINAEKPLGQLVKQRRRWLNGTFAANLWLLQEGIIMKSNQKKSTRLVKTFMVQINLIQAVIIRLGGPAILMAMLYRIGLVVPDILTSPSMIFDVNVSLHELESEHDRFMNGATFFAIYLGLYIIFIAGHIPRAKPIADDLEIVRYTEPDRFRSDRASAYRSFLFYPTIWVNALVMFMFVGNSVGILATLGWGATPFLVKFIFGLGFLPFIVGFLYGILRADMSCFWRILVSAPFTLPLMIWFSVWLPAYATTRVSDLTWGNRDSLGGDESKAAKKRARNGQVMALFLVVSNALLAFGLIAWMQVNDAIFPSVILGYTLILSMNYILVVYDLLIRLCGCLCSPFRGRGQVENETDGYVLDESGGDGDHKVASDDESDKGYVLM